MELCGKVIGHVIDTREEVVVCAPSRKTSKNTLAAVSLEFRPSFVIQTLTFPLAIDAGSRPIPNLVRFVSMCFCRSRLTIKAVFTVCTVVVELYSKVSPRIPEICDTLYVMFAALSEY